MPRMLLGPSSLPRLALVFGASLLVMGCAGSAPPRSHGGAVPTDHPRIALLPFENLSGREEQGRMFTQAFLAALVETDAAEIVDLGQVETTMEALRIRATGAPSHQQLKAIGESLQVRYVLVGSVLEAGTIRSYDGDIPSAGASLRLVDVVTARIVWARAHVLTGDDRETVFGWGRERSAERLLTKLAEEMLRPFREAGNAWRKRAATNVEAR